MIKYVTYHKIIDLLESVQQASPRMKSFAQGDIVYFADSMSGNTIQYPLMFATPLAMSYDENTTTYQMSIIFADIVHTDLSNEVDVVTDMELEARSLLSQIKRGTLIDKVDCILPATSTPFFERFNDHVGGVVLDVSLIVFEDINACEPYPSPSVAVSPTPSASVTPTPTITASPTPTPTVTPSCTLITQYLTGLPQGSNNINFLIWQNSGHTISAQSQCSISIGFTVIGNLGGTGSSTTTFPANSTQHNVNVNSLIPGENAVSVTITSAVPGCACYNVVY
jgi:hypothetical protein